MEDAERVGVGDGDVVLQVECQFNALLLLVERGVLTIRRLMDPSVDSHGHWGRNAATALPTSGW